MKKTAALLTLTSLPFLLSVEAFARHVVRSAPLLNLSGPSRIQAPPQAAHSPRWQSREEYDAFTAITEEQGKNPEAQIALAEAFIRRFPGSDFRSASYLTEMRCYNQLNKIDLSVDAARNTLRFDRDNLEALAHISYVFPFTFQQNNPAARSILAVAHNDARHGMDALQRLQRPARLTPEQFQPYVTSKRAIFTSTMGFVALQRQDYANAIVALNASVADNPTGVLAFSWLANAYLFSTPADYDHGIWYLARAVGLARISLNPAGRDISRYLRNVFVRVLGSDAGLEETITQALASVNPPGGLDPAIAPRGRRGLGPNGFASSTHKPTPSGTPGTGQTSNVTINRVYASIYPTWLPAPENESRDATPPPPPPAEPFDQSAAQRYYLTGEMGVISQEQQGEYARASIPEEPPEPEPAPPATVLVYKDGHKVEAQNYAVVGANLIWFSGPLSKKIPLADLDLPATRKINEDHGIAFGAPDTP